MFGPRIEKPVLILLATLPAAGLLGCGAGGPEGSSSGSSSGAAPAASAQPVAIANPATIRGVINFEGAAPTLQRIDMSTEPQCASVHTEQPVQESAMVRDGKLANVFIYVKEGLTQQFPPSSQPAEIDQQGCVYHPRVLGIQVGQPLLIKNADPLLHNVNVQPRINRNFNISQPRQMETTRPAFTSAEVMIGVKCNVHGWMEAFIAVVEHPYFAVSSADGSFTIPRLPPGNYVLEAWHERYGTQTLNVAVGPDETREVSFTYADRMAANAVVPLSRTIDLHEHETSEAHLHVAAAGL